MRKIRLQVFRLRAISNTDKDFLLKGIKESVLWNLFPRTKEKCILSKKYLKNRLVMIYNWRQSPCNSSRKGTCSPFTSPNMSTAQKDNGKCFVPEIFIDYCTRSVQISQHRLPARCGEIVKSHGTSGSALFGAGGVLNVVFKLKKHFVKRRISRARTRMKRGRRASKRRRWKFEKPRRGKMGAYHDGALVNRVRRTCEKKTRNPWKGWRSPVRRPALGEGRGIGRGGGQGNAARGKIEESGWI